MTKSSGGIHDVQEGDGMAKMKSARSTDEIFTLKNDNREESFENLNVRSYVGKRKNKVYGM